MTPLCSISDKLQKYKPAARRELIERREAEAVSLHAASESSPWMEAQVKFCEIT
jgi:hypothetical protein